MTGSKYYFSEFENFYPHDTDYIVINHTSNKIHRHYIQNKTCYFVLNFIDKKQLIDFIKLNNLPMQVSMLLQHEFAKDYNITIDDLKDRELINLVLRMNKKHKYLKYIYFIYIKNDGFFLTDKQRRFAYKLYLEERINKDSLI